MTIRLLVPNLQCGRDHTTYPLSRLETVPSVDVGATVPSEINLVEPPWRCAKYLLRRLWDLLLPLSIADFSLDLDHDLKSTVVMLSRLLNAFSSPVYPSAILIVGDFSNFTHILHLLPEDGTVERFSLTAPGSSSTFRYCGATEQSRERIGTVKLHVGDGETAGEFLEDVEERVRKLWNDGTGMEQKPTGTTTDVLSLAQDVLQRAAHEAIRVRDGREGSMNATQTYPVSVLRINRARPGRIITDSELTSFPH